MFAYVWDERLAYPVFVNNPKSLKFYSQKMIFVAIKRLLYKLRLKQGFGFRD